MKVFFLICLVVFFSCQEPCEVCEDCSWDNELAWAISIKGKECMYIEEDDKCLDFFKGSSNGFDFIKVRKIIVTDIVDREFILNVVPGGDYEQIFEMGYDYVKYKKVFKDDIN